ncbi:unnamed protein product [Effrenium voratum]|uniref:Transmembrane protein n=1 Tax=Effrenium voratum TaxID=2562239 RepID=A0AA36I6E8_9DINO|nr:unnamed protein product [Effrenium voratum]CAJ1444967.1 unnamed protein product [Effrenium voratum]
MRRCSAGSLTVLALVCYLGGNWLFASPSRGQVTRRAADPAKPRDLEPQLSPEDVYEMPRSPEDEKNMQFWSSDFDSLPAEEKLQSPLVVIGLALLVLPFAWGVFFLVTGGGLDE